MRGTGVIGNVALIRGRQNGLVVIDHVVIQGQPPLPAFPFVKPKAGDSKPQYRVARE